MTPVEEARRLWQLATFETNYRTVASRAYYASFNRCMAYSGRRGFKPTGTGEDHTGVSAFLRDRRHHAAGANLLHRIGANCLPKLKRLRTLADYNQARPFDRQSAADAISLLNEIIGYMDEIEGSG